MRAQAAILLITIPSLAAAKPHHSHRDHQPSGNLQIINDSGGTVLVRIDESRPQRLSAGEVERVWASGHRATVRASYQVFGIEQTLEVETVRLFPHDLSTVVLERERDAFILVSNRTRFPSELYADGRLLTRLSAGDSEVIQVQAGQTHLQLSSRGRIIADTHLRASAFVENIWTVDLPAVTDVVISNPLPIPVVIESDRGRSVQREIPAFGKVVFDQVDIGRLELTARRITGESFDHEVLRLSADRRSYWTIQSPTTGFLLVDNDHNRSITVRVDGIATSTIGVGRQARLELPIGSHRITVTDDHARKIEDSWLTIDPFADIRMDTRLSRGTPVSHRDEPRRPGIR